MHVIASRRLKTDTCVCLYNTSRFSAEEVQDLLANQAEKLFANAVEIGVTEHAASFRLQVGGHTFYAKKYHCGGWSNRLRDRIFRPTCFRNFRAADRLLIHKLRTPSPILAAVLKAGSDRQQILVTDFCEDAVPLDQFIQQHSDNCRQTIIPELAEFLTAFHRQGFYSRQLRSANILVQEKADRRLYWYTDCHPLCCSRLLPKRYLIRTVALVVSGLYGHLPQKDRRFLLATCFDTALKKNIFPKPSQQERFIESTLRQIRERTPTS